MAQADFLSRYFETRRRGLGVKSWSSTYTSGIDRFSSAFESKVLVNKLSTLGSIALFRCSSRPLYCLRAEEQNWSLLYEYMEAMSRDGSSTPLTVFNLRLRAYH